MGLSKPGDLFLPNKNDIGFRSPTQTLGQVNQKRSNQNQACLFATREYPHYPVQKTYNTLM